MLISAGARLTAPFHSRVERLNKEAVDSLNEELDEIYKNLDHKEQGLMLATKEARQVKFQQGKGLVFKRAEKRASSSRSTA